MQDKLRYTKDERMANEIMQVLSRLRMRTAAAVGTGTSAEIGEISHTMSHSVTHNVYIYICACDT